MWLTFPEYTIRLVNQYGYISTSQGYGRVEVKRSGYNESFGTICDDSFDNTDAKVVCRQLGFAWVIKLFHYLYFGINHIKA